MERVKDCRLVIRDELITNTVYREERETKIEFSSPTA